MVGNIIAKEWLNFFLPALKEIQKVTSVVDTIVVAATLDLLPHNTHCDACIQLPYQILKDSIILHNAEAGAPG